MDLERGEKRRLVSLSRSQRSHTDLENVEALHRTSPNVQISLPAIEVQPFISHKRCVSFKEPEQPNSATSLVQRKMRIKSDFDGLSKYSKTLDQVADELEKFPSKRKSNESETQLEESNRRLRSSMTLYLEANKSIDKLVSLTDTKKPLQYTETNKNSKNFGKQLSEIKTSSSNPRLSFDGPRAGDHLKKEDPEKEIDFLRIYIECLKNACEGQDIMRQQAMTIFRLETELRNLELKMVSYDRERTILESIDGSSFRTKTQDGRLNSEFGSQRSINQYKAKLQEVNKQLSSIEERRKLIRSLETDIEKLQLRKSNIEETAKRESDFKRLEEVSLSNEEIRTY